MQCDTSSCLCRFHFFGATFGPHEFIRNLKHLSYSTPVILILWKLFTCPLGKLNTEFTSPIAKSTSPGLSDTTFFTRCLFTVLTSFSSSNICVERTEFFVHWTDYWVQRSDLKRSHHGTEWPWTSSSGHLIFYYPMDTNLYYLPNHDDVICWIESG